MLRNYLLIAVRNLRRKKLYSTINVAGLAVAMAGFSFIMLFLRHELAYDRFHHGADRIYRVIVEMSSEGFHGRAPIAPSAMAAALREQVPEVEAVGRIWQPLFTSTPKPAVRVGDDVYYDEDFFWADPDLFEVLSFEFLRGDRKTALADPEAVVLSESAAHRYFGDLDPVGQTLNGGRNVVSAVVRDFPTNSHMRFDLLAAASGTDVDRFPERQRWWDHSYPTYLLAREGADTTRIVQQMNGIVQGEMGEIYRQMNQEIRYELQPIVEVHLHSDFYANIGSTGGNVAHVYAYGAIAVFLLLLAIINFTNLATARSSERLLEVGVRKAVGAHRNQLARQFLGEAIILAFASLGVALIIMAMAAPWFHNLTGMEFAPRLLQDARIPLMMVGMALATGLCAGLHPALQLSALHPHAGAQGAHRSHGPVRRAAEHPGSDPVHGLHRPAGGHPPHRSAARLPAVQVPRLRQGASARLHDPVGRHPPAVRPGPPGSAGRPARRCRGTLLAGTGLRREQVRCRGAGVGDAVRHDALGRPRLRRGHGPGSGRGPFVLERAPRRSAARLPGQRDDGPPARAGARRGNPAGRPRR